MPAQGEVLAADVFAIIEEPTVQTGPVRKLFLMLLAPFSGQMLPEATHPVVVEKATGKRVKGSATALSAMIEVMKTDLGTMSASEFSRRYLDT